MTNEEPVRVLQLSDTHFLEPGESAEGGYAYDTSEAFAAVAEHAGNAAEFDLVTVTGDVADHGRPEQYRIAAAALSSLDAPVNVCPGNHDFDEPFSVGLARPAVGLSRVIEAGAWCFLFVDSNAGAMVPDHSGRLVDSEESAAARLHQNGLLGDRERSWIQAMCAATAAEHVFVWMHHPPGVSGFMESPTFNDDWHDLLGGAALSKVRGFGAGHTHIPDEWSVAGRPVFVAPSLKTNFDLEAETLLPPGYRTYDFAPDGSVSSELHLVDGPRWRRFPLSQRVLRLFRGELSFEEFDAEVAEHGYGS